MSTRLSTQPISTGQDSEAHPPGDLRMTWLIAQRAAVESLRDRMTVAVNLVWALVVPLLVVVLVVRPSAHPNAAATDIGFSTLIATYLLAVGLLPAGGSVGIASGLFAGEREQGTLLPLLATPASNRAIFAGKVLGAVLPALLFAAVAVASYLVEIGTVFGVSALARLPVAYSLAMVALTPADAVLGAAIASLVSSRTRTFSGAQMVSSLILYPIMAALFALALRLRGGSPGELVVAVAVVLTLDLLLVLASAATWRREEVFSQS